MANIILKPNLTIDDKLLMMQESAIYDIADDEILAESCMLDNPDIKNIRAPSSPPKVPKMFVSNNCIFNCAYCGCRSSNDCKRRYVLEPREIAKAAIEAAKKNGHGVFITSAIYKNSDYTEELIIETLRIMRKEYQYAGYIHAKIMPGADPKLIEQAGYLADRISINIELPKIEGYALIAKQKNKENIFTPMQFISDRIKESKMDKSSFSKKFARSGQTTQVMVGTMFENDRTILCLAESLYKKYALRRVYYSPFNPVQEYEHLPSAATASWRSRRLYQADRLLQLYGFEASDIAPVDHPDFDYDLDPKAGWALRNLQLYPVEVNTADYEALIRVPGIGITSAKKIIEARKSCKLSHDVLLKLGISLKRAAYFITCNGKYNGGDMLDSPLLRTSISDKVNQMSLFENMNYNSGIRNQESGF